MTRSEQLATGKVRGITAHAPGFPVRTITTSPGDNADFRNREWKVGLMCFKSASSIRNGSTSWDLRKGMPSEMYSEAIGPTWPTVISRAKTSKVTSRQL